VLVQAGGALDGVRPAGVRAAEIAMQGHGRSVRRALTRSEEVRHPPPPVKPTAQEPGAHLDAYLDALLQRRTADARATVHEALAAGLRVEDVYLEIFAPALHRVGHRWAVGDLNVTATPGELHALGPRMVGDFLEADGWEVLQLGASTPAADLAELAGREAADLIALSTSTARALPEIADVLGRLGALDPRPLVAVGGQFWTAETSRTAQELGADLVARDPRMLVAMLRERVPVRE
jgi:MerR family transcriptional regulator, light-induced transcriptional regulator